LCSRGNHREKGFEELREINFKDGEGWRGPKRNHLMVPAKKKSKKERWVGIQSNGLKWRGKTGWK